MRGIAQPNGVLIGNSTDGNTPNIRVAVQVAGEIQLRQMAWTEQTGRKLADQCERPRASSTETAGTDECHTGVGHVLCELPEQNLFRK